MLADNPLFPCVLKKREYREATAIEYVHVQNPNPAKARIQSQIDEMTPEKRHAAQELCNAQEREQSQSQVAERNPVKGTSHSS